MADNRDFIKSKKIDSILLSLDEYISNMIVSLYLDEHPNDYSIYDCFNIKGALEERLLYDYGWERTPIGFEKNNNFRYSREKGELVFDRNFVTLINDGYITNGTYCTFDFITSHIKELESLAKAEQLINSYYIKYREKIEPRVMDRMVSMINDSINDKVDLEIKHTNNFLSVYGMLGENALVKWLNKLSVNEIDFNFLLQEFIDDINAIKMFYEISSYKEYLGEKINEFEFRLLKVLERYSSRGKFLNNMYSKYLNNENGKSR